MVVISAYFSGSETGMMTLNRYRLRHMAKQGNRSAKRVEKLLRKPDRLISLVLIGNNLVNILASALGTIVGMRLYGDAGVAIATGVLTFVVLVFAEVLPKTIAALYPEKVAYPSSFLLAPLQILMMPLVWLLNAITRMLMRMMGIKTDIVVSGSLSKEELRTIVHESRSQISRRNQDMLLSVLDLEKMTVDDIMVPRSEIIGIDINDDWKSILRQLSHSPHGRIVLYRDSLDDAISMLRVREAWRLMSEKKEFTKETMLRAADEIYFVPEGTPLSTQLVKFQRNKKKVGLVVNEYGDIQGLVTVEDILEEIVGDGTLVSAITSTPNLRTTSSIDFSVSSMPSTIADISGLALSATSSARSRLSITGSNSLMNFSSANLWAFSISSSVRRRRFSISAFTRKMPSRSRVWASAS